MIVRDEEDNLPACLASAAGLFDEIVVVDTGSTDRTVEIARRFGARVFDFVWVDDFAAARNAALARATGDYAFWLDADDVLDPPQRDRLQALLAASTRRRGGLRRALRLRPGPRRRRGRDGRRPRPALPLPRGRALDLPRPRADPAGAAAGGRAVRWTDVIVRHTGYTDLALRRRKLETGRGDPAGRTGRPAR